MIDADRILEGIARTLEQSVLPAVEGGFARGQLHAVLDVLAGLRGQVDWGGALRQAEAAQLEALAFEVASRVDEPMGGKLRAYAAGDGGDEGTRLERGRALVCELISSGLADDGEVRGAVDAWLANDTILKAMALPPTRLAEISQG